MKFNPAHILRIIKFGWKNLWLHKLRSFLTILGIVFGVASVISMLAIGQGASYETQKEIETLGSHNIIIKAVKPPPVPQTQQGAGVTLNVYGLTGTDRAEILTVPSVASVTPTWEMTDFAWNYAYNVRARIVGTLPGYTRSMHLAVAEGRFFNRFDVQSYKPVAVIGSSVKAAIFPGQNPLGKTVKIKGDYFKVIGVIGQRALSLAGSKFTSEDVNFDIYVPLSTMRMFFGEYQSQDPRHSVVSKVQFYRFIVYVPDLKKILATASVINGILSSNHTVPDYQMLVPLQLLQEEEHRKKIFSVVLGSIAAISLLVGGIGIMNIMLATVTERTREIGIRRALGAKRSDIIHQFLGEAVILSALGGLVGVVLGFGIPEVITHFSRMTTIITFWSVVLSFSISVAVGVAFGIYPARKAALLDPIEALRYE